MSEEKLFKVDRYVEYNALIKTKETHLSREGYLEMSLSPAMLETMKNLMNDMAKDYEDKLGPAKPVTVTTIKPDGPMIAWDSVPDPHYGPGPAERLMRFRTYSRGLANKNNDVFPADLFNNPYVMDGPRRYREPSGPNGNPCHEIHMDAKTLQECSLEGPKPFENQVTIE